MKALYVVSAYSRHAGDVITPWLGETLCRLRDAGVEAEVLAPSYRGQGGGELDGIRVHRYRYAPAAWEALTHEETAPDRVRNRPAYLALVPGYVIGGMLAARKLARHGGYQLVHVHWPIPHALIGLAARNAVGVPLICTFHGVELTWTRRQLKPLLPFLRYVIRTADAVTANSSYTADLIRGVYDRPVVRLPFGATIDTDQAVADSSGPAGTSGFELLFVGRLVERKGVQFLLEALGLLADSRIRLRIVGDGPLRGQLERRTTELGLDSRVVFSGLVSKEELARRFRECDAFVLPAVVDRKGDVEGLGVVLIEALSYGKPVIASAAGGIVDIVRDGETGLLVEPGDAAALAAAIRTLAESPRLATALGEGGRAHVDREFSWPVIISRLVGLYEDVVSGAHHCHQGSQRT